jgi:mannose-6-phosphate isomerase-like protein (cupin superfamily)
MKTIRLSELEIIPNRPSTKAYDLTEALGTADVGLRYYELEPGELIGRTYHKHDDQEEIFFVTEGTITFQVGDETGPNDTVDVEGGESIRFAPSEFQRGTNQSDECAAVLGIGAPKGMSLENVVRLRECDECDEWTPQRIENEAGVGVSYCDTCGEETGRWE